MMQVYRLVHTDARCFKSIQQ